MKEETKSLTLKIKREVWLAWKMRAAEEDTTMSELAERLVTAYVKGGKPSRKAVRP